MHQLTELSPWERMLKQMVWKQLGLVEGKRILDFGSGQGITANYFARQNEVIAVETSRDMLAKAWRDYRYEQLVGGMDTLSAFDDEAFDMVLCHNVLEYIEDKESAVQSLTRVLKKGGTLSVVKHNRAGRVMQMAVLLDDFEKANAILDGGNSSAVQFGEIRYYNDEELLCWAPSLSLSQSYGIRTFWDLQQNQQKHLLEDWQEQMLLLETKVSRIPQYRDIAFFHHLLLERK